MEELQNYSWSLTFRGIAAVLFGIAAVFWPGITLVTLLYLFSAWILVDGVIRIVTGIGRIGKHQLGFMRTLVGLLELGVGVYLLRHPHVTFATLILLISFLLIIDGVIAVVVSLTDDIETAASKTLAVIVGIAAVLAGILLLFQPASAGVAFVWILGLYALISGPMLIAASLDMRNVISGKKR